MPPKQPVPPSYDLEAEIKQSAVDKVLNSTTYPLKLSEQWNPHAIAFTVKGSRFPNKSQSELIRDAVTSKWSVEKEKKAAQLVIAGLAKEAQDKAQKLLADPNSIKRLQPDEVKKAKSLSTTDGVVSILDDSLEFRVSYVRVDLQKRPDLKLSSPKIALHGLQVKVIATGQVWATLPWWLGGGTYLIWEFQVQPIVDASADLTFSTSGAKVLASGQFTELHLDGWPVDQIDFAFLVNLFLADQTVVVYDATPLIQTIPLLNSNFAVSKIDLPPDSDGVSIQITLKQIVS